MTHPRKQIRADFKGRLTGSLPDYATVAKERVYASATPPIDLKSVLLDEGPVIMCYVRDEQRSGKDQNGRDRYGSDGLDSWVRPCLEIVIEGIVVGANADDKCDDLAEAIEDLFDSYALPSHPAAEVRLKHTQIDIAEFADTYIGGVFMTYEVDYYKTWRATPDEAFNIDTLFSAKRTEEAELILRGNTPGAEVNDV